MSFYHNTLRLHIKTADWFPCQSTAFTFLITSHTLKCILQSHLLMKRSMPSKIHNILLLSISTSSHYRKYLNSLLLLHKNTRTPRFPIAENQRILPVNSFLYFASNLKLLRTPIPNFTVDYHRSKYIYFFNYPEQKAYLWYKANNLIVRSNHTDIPFVKFLYVSSHHLNHQCYLFMIWQLSSVCNAALCLSGVIPAQQDAST